MIASVPHEAASDERLTPVAYRLLIYLGGHDVHARKWSGTWCWESLKEIARAISTERVRYTTHAIKQARRLLRACGYLERRVGVFLSDIVQENGRAVRETHRVCYRVVVRLDEPIVPQVARPRDQEPVVVHLVACSM